MFSAFNDFIYEDVSIFKLVSFEQQIDKDVFEKSNSFKILGS